MKQIFAVLLIILALSCFWQTGQAMGPDYHWKIGHVRSEGSAIDRDVRWLVEKISRESEKQISFDIYPASQLGDYTIVQERCSFGDVEMYIGPFGTMTDKRLALPFIPYLVTTWADAKRVYARDSVMMAHMADILAKQNIKLLGGWPVYFGGIVLTQESPAPADPDISKDLIIRVPPIRAFELTAQALGYMPYPITWSYARSGLKTGMVQGLLGGGAEGYLGLKHLARHYLAVHDHFEYWFIYMNLNIWQQLSEDHQALIQQAVWEVETRRFDAAESEEQANLKRLADQGTTITTFTPEELQRMADKIRSQVWPILRKEIGADLFDEVVSAVHQP